MLDNKDNKLERLTNEVMKHSSIESPSFDFTNKVMDKIEALQINHITVYKPLISKRGWVLIILLTITVFGYLLYGNAGIENSWLNSIDYSFITNNKITQILTSLSISNTTFYSILAFGIMLFIQIPIMKNYFEKRLEV